MYRAIVAGERYHFPTLAALMAQATPLRSGDQLAGVAAKTQAARVAAQMALADLPLTTFLTEAVVPYETDEVTRLIIDSHDAAAFAPVRHLTVGGFRDWLLSDEATGEVLAYFDGLADGLFKLPAGSAARAPAPCASVATTAMAMPATPMRLPRREVSGCDRPRRASTNRTAATR